MVASLIKHVSEHNYEFLVRRIRSRTYAIIRGTRYTTDFTNEKKRFSVRSICTKSFEMIWCSHVHLIKYILPNQDVGLNLCSLERNC